jgi:hypothetical protein
MARLRTVKPGFFTNDVLAEVDPLGRLLFIGLWTVADREGKLEDRPKRLKAELLPYDDCDVDALLNALATHGFIIRYEVGGNGYIMVQNFLKHQYPNAKEAASVIPSPHKHHESTVQASGNNDASTSVYPYLRESVSPLVGSLLVGSTDDAAAVVSPREEETLEAVADEAAATAAIKRPSVNSERRDRTIRIRDALKLKAEESPAIDAILREYETQGAWVEHQAFAYAAWTREPNPNGSKRPRASFTGFSRWVAEEARRDQAALVAASKQTTGGASSGQQQAEHKDRQASNGRRESTPEERRKHREAVIGYKTT